jgi:broad specificity phosphatase PhoE
MTSKFLTLVRHSQTYYNMEETTDRNSGLTERGIVVSGTIKGNYDLVICSPMKRTRQTLDFSKVTFKKVIYTNVCREEVLGNDIITDNTQIDKFKRYLQLAFRQYDRIMVITHGSFLLKLTDKWFLNSYWWDVPLNMIGLVEPDPKDNFITLIRHAQSESNVGPHVRNSKLTDVGRQQASTLTGDYDLVICSPLKRCRETLDYSKITYKRILFTEHHREIMNDNIDNYIEGEEVKQETEEHFNFRTEFFKDYLKGKAMKYKRIVVIGHGYFLGVMIQNRFSNCQSHKFEFYTRPVVKTIEPKVEVKVVTPVEVIEAPVELTLDLPEIKVE